MSECTTAEFRIGDVVRLKSGGPDMTITAMEAEDGADETRIFAVWHDGEVLTRAEFPEVVLEHARQGTKARHELWNFECGLAQADVREYLRRGVGRVL